jgi:hypothetical protein
LRNFTLIADESITDKRGSLSDCRAFLKWSALIFTAGKYGYVEGLGCTVAGYWWILKSEAAADIKTLPSALADKHIKILKDGGPKKVGASDLNC